MLVAVVFSCKENKTDTGSVYTDDDYLMMGDSIATAAQKLLLSNVSTAIQEKGVAEAVSFCSERAIPLTDSSSVMHKAKISRITDKNRNPDNILNTESDKKAWQHIEQFMSDENIPNKHLVTREGEDIYYYKAIPLGMPTCLSCHGDKEKDIDAGTMTRLQTLYPHDKATGYTMGELRGLWKIQLN